VVLRVEDKENCRETDGVPVSVVVGVRLPVSDAPGLRLAV